MPNEPKARTTRSREPAKQSRGVSNASKPAAASKRTSTLRGESNERLTKQSTSQSTLRRREDSKSRNPKTQSTSNAEKTDKPTAASKSKPGTESTKESRTRSQVNETSRTRRAVPSRSRGAAGHTQSTDETKQRKEAKQESNRLHRQPVGSRDASKVNMKKVSSERSTQRLSNQKESPSTKVKPQQRREPQRNIASKGLSRIAESNAAGSRISSTPPKGSPKGNSKRSRVSPEKPTAPSTNTSESVNGKSEINRSPSEKEQTVKKADQKSDKGANKDANSDGSDLEADIEEMLDMTEGNEVSLPNHTGNHNDVQKQVSGNLPHAGNATNHKAEEKEPDDDEDEDYNYDDDFEDYESDFEDYMSDDDNEDEEDDDEEEEDSGGVGKMNGNIMDNAAVSDQKEHSFTLQRPQSVHDLQDSAPRKDVSLSEPSTPMAPPKSIIKNMPTSRSFINFSSAKGPRMKNEQAAKKLKSRGQELLELITLDKVGFDLFDMPPVNYDIFIRTFGQANTKQAYTQTGNMEEVDVQTDPLNLREKWTQHPAHDHKGFGGDQDGEFIISRPVTKFSTANAIAFNEFVQRAGQVIISLLDEEMMEQSHSNLIMPEDSLGFSNGYFTLSRNDVLQDCVTTQLHFDKNQANFLLSTHDILSETSLEKTLSERGLLCVWNINHPSEPSHMLIAPAPVTCCSFGPNGTTVVLAGMFDGSVGIWDLQEPSYLHKEITVGEVQVSMRRPTFCTASVLRDEGHHSSVVAICPVIYSIEREEGSETSGRAMSTASDSFHIISLEDLGMLHIWVVVEVIDPDIAGSDIDLGLAPGGKIKLIRSSTINIAHIPGIIPDIRTFDFRVSPLEPSHMFVTTDAGIVIHCTHYGGKAVPQIYAANTEMIAEIRTIDFNPHLVPVFLVGSSDGTLKLYSARSEYPKLEWQDSTNGEGIAQLEWSTCRPTVFFVLDSASCLHVWDLDKNDSGPVFSTIFEMKRPVHFSISANSSSDETDQDYIVFAMEGGDIEIYPLDQDQFGKPSETEYQRLRNYLLDI